LDLRTNWPYSQLAVNIFNPQSKFQNLKSAWLYQSSTPGFH